MFCSKCGALMTPSRDKYICNSCGNEIPKAGTADQKIISKSSDKEIIMVAKEVNAEPLDSDAVCPVRR